MGGRGQGICTGARQAPARRSQLSARYAFSEMQLGRFAEARRRCAGAVEHDPDDEAAQALYARLLLKRGALDKGAWRWTTDCGGPLRP